MPDQAQTPQTTETPFPTDAITPDAASIVTEPVQDNSTTELPSFTDQLSDEYREAPGLKKFAKGGADAIAKSYLELEAKLSSGDKLALPNGTLEEDPDGWEKVFERLGRPEGADKYTFLGEAETDPLLNPYAEQSHKLGLSDIQAKGVYEWFKGETAQLAEQAREAGTTVLKQEWGPDFSAKLAVADEFLGERISSQFSEVLKQTGIAHNPEFVKFVHEAAVFAREDASFRAGEGEVVPQALQDNPYVKGTPHFNMTRQGQLERSDPQLATRYRQEAGYTGH
jgi:hypothetical protein